MATTIALSASFRKRASTPIVHRLMRQRRFPALIARPSAMFCEEAIIAAGRTVLLWICFKLEWSTSENSSERIVGTVRRAGAAAARRAAAAVRERRFASRKSDVPKIQRLVALSCWQSTQLFKTSGSAGRRLLCCSSSAAGKHSVAGLLSKCAAAHQSRELLGDREPQSRAAEPPRCGRVGLTERREQ